MIAVTRLNGSRFAVNPDLVERVQENPDTTLVMVGGATYVVRESLPEIIALIVDFRAVVIAAAQSVGAGGGSQPGASQPGASQPGASQPSASQPRASQPGGLRPAASPSATVSTPSPTPLRHPER